jgi:hypothetical protein
MIKNFESYLNENLHDAVADKLSDTRESLKKDILDAIESTINSYDIIELQNWIGGFEDGDSNTIIDSLTDASNLYDFYLKHQDDIDAVLGENKWFDNTMNALNLSSLYDVVVEGTRKGIELTVADIKAELF